MENNDKKFDWYALMCIPNHENAVKRHILHNLNRQNLQEYVDTIHIPVVEEVSLKNGKKVTKEKTIIPGYILLHMDITNGEVVSCIKTTKGVSAWLNPSDGKLKQLPEKLRESDVNRFLNENKKKEIVEDVYLIGEHIQIVNGVFSTFKGVIQTMNNEKINVTTDIFGRQTMVELHISDIKKID